MDRIIKSDVLVIGGGQAGFFAALKAQEQGVKVVMADKGYAGKSGQSQNITCMIYFDPKKTIWKSGWKRAPLPMSIWKIAIGSKLSIRRAKPGGTIWPDGE